MTGDKASTTNEGAALETFESASRLDGFEDFSQLFSRFDRDLRRSGYVNILGMPDTNPFAFAAALLGLTQPLELHSHLEAHANVPVDLTPGVQLEMQVVFQSGQRQFVSSSEIPSYGTEQGNPNNHKEVRSITVRVPSSSTFGCRIAPTVERQRHELLSVANVLCADSPLLIVTSGIVSPIYEALLRAISQAVSDRVWFAVIPADKVTDSSDVEPSDCISLMSKLEEWGYHSPRLVVIDGAYFDDSGIAKLNEQCSVALKLLDESARRQAIGALSLSGFELLAHLRRMHDLLDCLRQEDRRTGDNRNEAEVAYADSHLRYEAVTKCDTEAQRVARERITEIRLTLTLRLDAFLATQGGIVSELLESMPTASPHILSSLEDASSTSATSDLSSGTVGVKDAVLRVANTVRIRVTNWNKTTVSSALNGWAFQAGWLEAELRARVLRFTLEFTADLKDRIAELTHDLAELTGEVPATTFRAVLSARTKLPKGEISNLNLEEVVLEFFSKMIRWQAVPSRLGLPHRGSVSKLVNLGVRIKSLFHSYDYMPDYRDQRFGQQATEFTTALRYTWYAGLIDLIRQAESYVNDDVLGRSSLAVRISRAEASRLNSLRRYVDVRSVNEQLIQLQSHCDSVENALARLRGDTPA